MAHPNLTPGTTFPVGLVQMVEPLIGQIVIVKIDGHEVKARINSCDEYRASLTVVPDSVRE